MKTKPTLPIQFRVVKRGVYSYVLERRDPARFLGIISTTKYGDWCELNDYGTEAQAVFGLRLAVDAVSQPDNMVIATAEVPTRHD